MLGTWVIELTVKFPIIYIIGDDKIWTSLRQRKRCVWRHVMTPFAAKIKTFTM